MSEEKVIERVKNEALIRVDPITVDTMFCITLGMDFMIPIKIIL